LSKKQPQMFTTFDFQIFNFWLKYFGRFPLGRAIRYIFFTIPLRCIVKKDAAAITNANQLTIKNE